MFVLCCVVSCGLVGGMQGRRRRRPQALDLYTRSAAPQSHLQIDVERQVAPVVAGREQRGAVLARRFNVDGIAIPVAHIEIAHHEHVGLHLLVGCWGVGVCVWRSTVCWMDGHTRPFRRNSISNATPSTRKPPTCVPFIAHVSQQKLSCLFYFVLLGGWIGDECWGGVGVRGAGRP